MTAEPRRRELFLRRVGARVAALARVPALDADPMLAPAFAALDGMVVRHLKEQGRHGPSGRLPIECEVTAVARATRRLGGESPEVP